MSADEGKVRLVSSDGQDFTVETGIAKMSVTLRSMLEDLDPSDNDEAIPIPNITAPILQKVIEYCTHHKVNSLSCDDRELTREETDERRDAEIPAWDQDFCKVDQGTLFELILAANFLDVKAMLDLTCKTVANMIKGKKAEEIRRTFNIKNDFNAEDEELVRKENEWADIIP
eukprot:m.54917 g.54917  ORF g.54917 m.54917 type:complete len:172 (-) comp48819_c0_seq2:141-656(-)